MNLKKYISVLSVLLSGLTFFNPIVAGNTTYGAHDPVPNGTSPALRLNSQVQLGVFRMIITQLEPAVGDAASGQGNVYVPFLQAEVPVRFEHINVDAAGRLLTGEIQALNSGREVPDFRSGEAEVLDFLKMAEHNPMLPQRINRSLEARGIRLDGHDMILSQLVFTATGAHCDASLLVQNTDGRVTTFSGHQLPVTEEGIALCDAAFQITGGTQPGGSDPALPIIIKGFNVETGTGTYVTFSCDGFEEFHLEGEYHFDTDHIRLIDQVAPNDTVIASFSLITEVWGQFMAGIAFNGPFEIRGVDDVIITMNNATIDYSDTENPVDTSLTAYLVQAQPGTNKNLWRGFFIKSVSVQLPEALSISNGARITLAAENLIYDRSHGLTTNFSILGNPIVSGNLEGWGVDVRKIALVVRYSSPQKFEITGNVAIPLMKEAIPYAARLNFPAGGTSAGTTTTSGATTGTTSTSPGTSSSSTRASLSFVLNFSNNVFSVPLLKDARMTLSNSVAGFEYVNNKFTPYAHLNGNFVLDFASAGSESVAADFKFPDLGFQSLTLNYDAVGMRVLAEANATGGLRTMAVRAFSFAGRTFVNTPTTTEQTATVTEYGAVPPQTVKGFPIAIKNVGFNSVGDSKQLDFTIALNFTSPSVGLTASAALSITGRLDASKILTPAPWEALIFESLALNSILIGSQAQPVNIGGVKLYGGLLVIRKDPVYGDGFKGFLVMSLEPGITVDVVGQFGTIPKADNSLDYRYWFADARATIQAGIRLGPAPIGVFGFGGGVYYNMTQSALPAGNTIDVNTTTAPQPAPTGTTFTMAPNLLLPGQGLSCRYTPQNNVFGVKATVVLGTHPKPQTANMDLTLTIEFNTNPFGLKMVQLRGDMYFMAPIANRRAAKVKGTTAITYNHTGKLLTFDGSVTVAVKAGNKNILTGGGSVSMFFNLNPGQSDDWYLAIGAPPISRRMRLQFDFGTPQTIEGYFVAGNIQRLPPDQRNLPRLREYHPLLQQFEGQNNLNFGPLMNGNGILMGSRYVYSVNKKVWIVQVGLAFTVGFDAILTNRQCSGYDPTGIDNWHISGQIYAAFVGSLKLRVNLLFHKGTYTIASLNAAALITAELPNPTWMNAKIAGSYRILGGLVKGKFKLDVEFGEKCEEVGPILNAADVVAKIKVIGAIYPENNATDIPVFREKIVVTSFLENLNQVMDFSEESSDGLMVKPVIRSISFTGPVPPQGAWRYLNAANTSVGANGYYDHKEFVSTRLLESLAFYNYTIVVGWMKKTNDRPNWSDVYYSKADGGDSTVIYTESQAIRFKTANRPTELPREAVLASYPEYRGINYCILENPMGGGIALKQQGWGYLFNPKKRAKENTTPCDPGIFEYDYFVRVIDVASTQIVSEKPLTAVPVPEWNRNVGDPVYTIQRPCVTGNGFIDWLYRIFNIGCNVITQGPCSVMQPTAAAARSNVKNMANAWNFGGPTSNFDLAVSQNSNINDKAIGFPDFSAVLQKGKVYRFELVGRPILTEDTYTIGATQTVETVVTTPNGDYTVTSGNQTIQTQFSSGAPDKILYQSEFSTSQYNNFAEKLAATQPSYQSDDRWFVQVGQDTLFNYQDYKFHISDILPAALVALQPLIWSNKPTSNNDFTVPNQTVYNSYNITLSCLLGGAPNTMNYNVSGVSEGFDTYEMGRFGYFAQYDYQSGYLSYLNSIHPRFSSFPKVTAPFDNSIIPTGPYAFLLDPATPTSLLPQGATSKPNAVGLRLRFYPRTSGVYKLLKINYLIQNNTSFSYLKPHFTLDQTLAKINAIASYADMPANYGTLFKLTYRKGNTTAVLNFNKNGQSSGSYVDYSGEYFIRNVGSGRLLHENSTSQVVSTLTQTNSNNVVFILQRQSNGKYTIKNKATNRFLNATGTEVKGNASATQLTLVQMDRGAFRFETAANSPVYENAISKTLQFGAGTHYDYDRFFLESTWAAAPTDLNTQYRLRLENNGRYLYKGADRTGESLASTKDNKDNDAKFRLRRREGGLYDMTVGDRRIHAETLGSDWIYTSSLKTDLDEDHYLFILERVSDLKYRFKNKKSGQYLYEFFDIKFGTQHRQIIGSLQATDDGVFVLADAATHTIPTDFSGQYLLQSGGSGRFLSDDEQVISTRIQENTAAVRFILKKVTSDGQYEIWSKASSRRLHGMDNGNRYQSTNTGLAQAEYRFTLAATTTPDYYKFTKTGSNAMLIEQFDLDLGATHRMLRSVAANTVMDADYTVFKLLQEKNTDGTDTGNKYIQPNDVSGRYFIQTKGSERYLQHDPVNPLFSEMKTNFRNFVLKRRNGGDLYEIWCRNVTNGGRLYAKTDNGFTFIGTPPDAPSSLFVFTFNAGENAWTIRNLKTGNTLFEYFQPGNAYDKKLLSGASTGPHYSLFLLKDQDNAPLVFSGDYRIRSKTTNRYWWDTNLTDRAPNFSTSATPPATGGIFRLIPRGAEYEMETPASRTVLFSLGASGYTFATNTRFQIIWNEDGSVKFKPPFTQYFLENNNTISTGVAGANNTDFFLEPPGGIGSDNLSGAYRIQGFGSGQYWQTAASGTAVAGANDRSFLLQQQGTGIYEIRDQTSNLRLHAAQDASGNWIYTTAAATGLSEQHYHFKLIPAANGLYNWQNVASQQYLYEHFDLNTSDPKHKQILSAFEPQGEYGLFYLRTAFQSPPANLSGTWLLKGKGSGRYVHTSTLADGGQLSTVRSQADDDFIRYVLKRRASGNYEIWNKGTGRKVYRVANAPVSIVEPAAAPESDFVFQMIAQSDGSYMIRSGANTLLEVLDPSLGPTQGQIRSNGGAAPLYDRFVLETVYLRPNDLSGEYFLRTGGSGRHLFNNGNTLGTTASNNTNQVRFIFERQTDGSYKIKSKSDGRYLHLSENNTFSTAEVSNLADGAYKFDLVPAGALFHLRCKVNNLPMRERFELASNPQHRQIISGATQDIDYSVFRLESSYVSPPEDFSGDYLIRLTANGRHWMENADKKVVTGWPVADGNAIHFVLKRRLSGHYEIWSKQSAQRIKSRPLSSGFEFIAGNTPPLPGETDYLYQIERRTDGAFNFRNIAGGLMDETSQYVLGVGATAENFTLETSFSPATDVSGTYHIKVQGSKRHLFMAGTTLSTSWQDNSAQVQFILEKQPNNAFRIKSVATNQYLHTIAGSNLFSTAPANNLPTAAYEFNITAAGAGAYQIQSRANDLYLYEHFDLVPGPQHRMILGAAAQNNDYSYFLLESQHTDPGVEISGTFFVSTKGTEKLWNDNPENFVLGGTASHQYIFKPHANNELEIWSRNTQRRLYLNASGELTSAANTTLSEADYRFVLEASGDFSRLKYKPNNQYLYEKFTPGLSGQHGKVLGSADQQQDDGLFRISMQPATPPLRLFDNQSITIRNKGSEYDLYSTSENGPIQSGFNRGGGPNARFVLRWRPGGQYEIWSQATQQRIYLNNNGLSSAATPGLSNNHYLFSIERDVNHYRIKCVANNLFLNESFNPTLPQPVVLRGLPSPIGVEALFNLHPQFIPLQGDLSGQYQIRLQGTNRFLNSNQPVIATTTTPSLYYLRRREAGNYEIWSRDHNTRLTNNNGRLSATPPTGVNAAYIFRLDGTPNSMYIKYLDGTYLGQSLVECTIYSSWLSPSFYTLQFQAIPTCPRLFTLIPQFTIPQ